jgi:hypothetical protein
MVIEDDDEDFPEVVQPEPKSRGKGKAAASSTTNGKSQSRSKAKGKTTLTTNGPKNDSDLVIIEELNDDDPPKAKPPSPTKKAKPSAGSPVLVEEGEIMEGGEEREVAPSRELERLREERDLVCPLPCPSQGGLMNPVVQYKTKSEELSESLLQLIQTRNTEPEEQLADMKAQYDASTKGVAAPP